MSHVLLTQLNNNKEQKLVVKIADIRYTNEATDGTKGTYLNLISGTSIRVIESAETIHGKIEEHLYGDL